MTRTRLGFSDASYEDAKGPEDKAERALKGRHDKTDKEKGKTVPVPEPATVTHLLARRLGGCRPQALAEPLTAEFSWIEVEVEVTIGSARPAHDQKKGVGNTRRHISH